ncbi:MAG TPA: hypothetical protein VN081_04750 [Dongiaceae bacterium]|nr:hypothetical protein [Dongiaceae bacterium]
MLFDDLDDETRSKTIKWIEDSLFAAHLYGSQYFHDVSPTITGFSESLMTGPKQFKVHIPQGFLK